VFPYTVVDSATGLTAVAYASITVGPPPRPTPICSAGDERTAIRIALPFNLNS
jgi:hypothetical protein